MKPHNDDQLLNCAFGDITPDEAMRIEADAARNAELRERLDSYQNLRAGLRALGDKVPDHQLSNERLRDAILARGLSTTARPISSPRWWQMAWMPIAAAAIAAVVFMAKPNRPVTPSVAIKQGDNLFVVPTIDAPKASEAVAMRVSDDDAIAARNYAAVLGGMPIEGSAPSPRQREAVRPSPTSRRMSEGRTVPSAPMAMIASGGTGLAAAAAPTGPSAAFGSGAPSMDAPARDDVATHPIVLIDSEPDANTGASRATEVGSPSNVIVGG